jgi:hypothetical protein
LAVPTATLAIPAESDVVDATADILTAPAVPASITYTNDIKIIEVYNDKLLQLQKHALLTWGDEFLPIKIHDSFESSLKPIDISVLEIDSLLVAKKKEFIERMCQCIQAQKAKRIPCADLSRTR